MNVFPLDCDAIARRSFSKRNRVFNSHCDWRFVYTQTTNKSGCSEYHLIFQLVEGQIGGSVCRLSKNYAGDFTYYADRVRVEHVSPLIRNLIVSNWKTLLTLELFVSFIKLRFLFGKQLIVPTIWLNCLVFFVKLSRFVLIRIRLQCFLCLGSLFICFIERAFN